MQGKKALRQYSLQTIKKSVDMKNKLEDAILGSGSARSEMMLRRRNTPSSLQQVIAGELCVCVHHRKATLKCIEAPLKAVYLSRT